MYAGVGPQVFKEMEVPESKASYKHLAIALLLHMQLHTYMVTVCLGFISKLLCLFIEVNAAIVNLPLRTCRAGYGSRCVSQSVSWSLCQSPALQAYVLTNL